MSKKDELLVLLNKALELEHAARIQYLSHAETIKGENSEPIVARLKEIASDEEKHEGMFRQCIAMLGGTPSMRIAATHAAEGTQNVLATNIKDEKDAVDFYRTIVEKLKDARAELKYEYEFIEHRIRHVLVEEQEHSFELSSLL